MEQLGFPKIIKLGEYEFKFLTELEVERDNNGNVKALHYIDSGKVTINEETDGTISNKERAL